MKKLKWWKTGLLFAGIFTLIRLIYEIFVLFIFNCGSRYDCLMKYGNLLLIVLIVNFTILGIINFKIVKKKKCQTLIVYLISSIILLFIISAIMDLIFPSFK